MASEDTTHFTNVDQTAEPGFFIHFLDEANKLPDAIAWKPTILDGLHLQPGARVLDLGCGAGDAILPAELRVVATSSGLMSVRR
jgi:cyclopropane fatty-acyl-phospholipid synthase-like methyltransferase